MIKKPFLIKKGGLKGVLVNILLPYWQLNFLTGFLLYIKSLKGWIHENTLRQSWQHSCYK